ncbi:fimbria/pilus outer membrane usher protein [Saccharospirillum salsuginis]|uniref:Outer membrane usher protein n=1 Tax=Saccharospirillum salsuginis TaxID=418750 RepID=A0A918K1A7_9GAMM|nr:fimbria/pilus outer membrane usher protein [Saccharospirillum salsuginis]GGX39611.1 hypothetical protein GCM10007392_02580 [Saccharospirillum salsuginis]
MAVVSVCLSLAVLAENPPPMSEDTGDRPRPIRVQWVTLGSGERALPLAQLAEFGWALPNEGEYPVLESGQSRVIPLSALEEPLMRVNEREGDVSFQADDLIPTGNADRRDWSVPVVLNDQAPTQPLTLVRRQGRYFLPVETIEALNLDRAAVDSEFDGLYALDALSDGFFWLDLSRPRLTLWVQPGRFNTYVIERQRADPLVPQSGYSAVFDYRLTEGVDADATRWRTAYLDGAVSVGTAYCESQHLYRSRTEILGRLGSRCVLDRPRSLLSLVVGDTLTSSQVLGQTVSYGGVRIGTNTQLAPSWVTRPRPSLRGSVLTPAMLEVWINRNLVTRQDIPPGPFRLTGLPAASGVSEILSQVKESDGVPVTQRFSFYSDPSLLAEGLRDWSLSYGHRRIGTVDGRIQYDEDPFALLSGRYGLTNRLTVGGRAELLPEGWVNGLSGYLGLGPLGMLDLGGAASVEQSGSVGTTWLWGYSRRTSSLSFRIQEQRTDEGFIQLGIGNPNREPELDQRVTLGWSVRKGVSLSLGRFRRDYRDRDDQLYHSATLGLTMAGKGSLRFNVQDQIRPEPERRYSLAFTLSLGKGKTLSATASGDQLADRGVTYQYNAPNDGGYGYRLHAGVRNEVPEQDAELTLDGRLASLRVVGRRQEREVSGFAELSGALVFNETGPHLSRNPAGSYTVVDAGVPDIRVYKNNRLAGTTGPDGRIVVPGLKPYSRNRLRLASEDLPPSASLDEPGRQLVPGNRQVLTARFPVRFERTVQATLVNAEQEPLPAGTVVRVEGMDESLTLGHEGLFYVDVGPAQALQGQARTGDGQVCEFRVDLSGVDAYPANVGTLSCRSR